MRRREALMASAAILCGTPGCVGRFRGGDQSSDDPESEAVAVTEAFYRHATRGELSQANALLHPVVDEGLSETEAARLTELDATVHGVQYLSSAVGEGPNSWYTGVEMSFDLPGGESYRYEFAIELRRSEDEQRIYAGETDHFDTPGPPRAEWTVTASRPSTDEMTVEFRHDGGESIESTALQVQFADRAFSLGGSSVGPGDGVELRFSDSAEQTPGGTVIELGWRPRGIDGFPAPPTLTMQSTTLSQAAPGWTSSGVFTADDAD